eukprot:5179706-Prymnesium_polylepis.1
MSTTILRDGSTHHASAHTFKALHLAADRQRLAAPRPRPRAVRAMHRHGCLLKRLRSPWSYPPPTSVR